MSLTVKTNRTIGLIPKAMWLVLGVSAILSGLYSLIVAGAIPLFWLPPYYAEWAINMQVNHSNWKVLQLIVVNIVVLIITVGSMAPHLTQMYQGWMKSK